MKTETFERQEHLARESKGSQTITDPNLLIQFTKWPHLVGNLFNNCRAPHGVCEDPGSIRLCESVRSAERTRQKQVLSMRSETLTNWETVTGVHTGLLVESMVLLDPA